LTGADRVKLLHGPDRPPRLRRGDRAVRLYRDDDVLMTAWVAAGVRGGPLRH
jgi:hypothetical protein